MNFSAVPPAQGLYDPAFEHDSCGVAFVADAKGRRSHQIIAHGLTAVHNMEHRGAAGAEVNSGDGAGILFQVPDRFLREVVVDFPLPDADPDGQLAYAVGLVFLPANDDGEAAARDLIDEVVAQEQGQVLGWRQPPVDSSMLGPTALGVLPRVRQIFLTFSDSAGNLRSGLPLERMAFVARKRIERISAERDCGVYFPSLSSRTIVYKGMLTTDQLPAVVFRRPDRSAYGQRHRPGAQPVLHEHVPVVAARASVPDHRPQRRDQHHPGQPELDAGPRGVACHAGH